MKKISVVIPFYQKTSGILRQSILSILNQEVPAGFEIDILIVDDGSAVPAHTEMEGIAFHAPFHVIVIAQPNGGVSAARNAALKQISDDTRYIAFLDSDDCWTDIHLKQAVTALESGYDFYFCDNRREGYHDSCFRDCSKLILPFIEKSKDKHCIPLTKDEVSGLILKEFVTQASTTVYRRDVAKDLLFNTTFHNAGEDIVFFLQLVQKTDKICFSSDVDVICGAGINIYYANLSWNSEAHIKQIRDRLKSHIVIKNTVDLSDSNAQWNDAFIARLKRNFVFHSLRKIKRSKGKCLPDLNDITESRKYSVWWFLYYSIQVIMGKALGLYKPD